MAISVAVFVGESAQLLGAVVTKAAALKVDAGAEAGADLGPLISVAARRRAEHLIQTSVDAGATCTLDGSSPPSTSLSMSLDWLKSVGPNGLDWMED